MSPPTIIAAASIATGPPGTRERSSPSAGAIAGATPAAAGRSAPERLGELFDRHHQRLFLLACRLTSDREGARDLVQEVFLRAARHAAGVPADAAHGEAWLVRTMVNLCRDHHRRAAVRARAQSSLAAATLRAAREALLAAAAVVAVCVLATAEWRALLPWRRQGGAPALAARRRPPEAEHGPAANPPAPSAKAGAGTAAPPPPRLARAAAAGAAANAERSLPRERAERPATTGAPGETATAAKAAEPMRQVQFSTPGGTRIIWLVRGESRSR